MEQYEIDHYNLVRQAGAECMVLLKTDGTFPLTEPCKIAAFGGGVRHTIKGGGGSGDVNVRAYTTVEQGLQNAGFTITSDVWLDAYDQVMEAEAARHMALIMQRIQEIGLMGAFEDMEIHQPDYDIPLEGEGDTAIYVLDRNSTEGADHQVKPGDFLLSDIEIRDIRSAARHYQRFMLVINSGCFVDLTPVLDIVPNILLLSETGIAIGDSFTDVLLGKATPSGKLASTWSRYEDYPSKETFAAEDDVEYREGIYVGYRFFDTAEIKPLFPFGFGLSYTHFALVPGALFLHGTKIHAQVKVENNGSYNGKEVVQLYVSLPSGELAQPIQTLAAFEKTKELAPGESEMLDICFDLSELRSYDEKRSARILEAGDFVIRIGNSSRETKPVGVVRLDKTVVFERLTHIGGCVDFEELRLSRPAEKLPDLPVLPIKAEAFAECCEHPQVLPVPTNTAQKLAAQLSDEELATLCIGSFQNGNDNQSFIGNAGTHVSGSAGESSGILSGRGIPSLSMVDGPQGLRVSQVYCEDENGFRFFPEGTKEYGIKTKFSSIVPLEQFKYATEPAEGAKEIHRVEQNCTAIPVGMALAQSWNPALVEAMGDLVGDEMKRVNARIWLAPALNIHRDPLCGRNFEYYSEDPLLSGRIAAAMVRGTQKHPGCSVTVKHFCCNNQETNRMYNNSKVSERVLRDIYLRGFEIAVKEAQPHCVMTSYNLLNGIHTSERRDLLETVLREEWGFKGMVMSDWVVRLPIEKEHVHRTASTPDALAAGNDIFMPGCKEDYDAVLAALRDEKHPLTREQLETSAARIIDLAWKLA